MTVQTSKCMIRKATQERETRKQGTFSQSGMDDSPICQAFTEMQLSSVEVTRKMTLFALNVASYTLTLGAYGSAVMDSLEIKPLGLISSEPTLKRRMFQNFIIATAVLVDTDS